MSTKSKNGNNTNNTTTSSSKVTADSYGRLDVSEADRECWMLRVPPKLAEAFQDAPEGTVLGELVFRKGGGTADARVKPSLEVHVDPSLSRGQTALPLQYSLQAMTKKLPTLHPFTRRPDGSVRVHGTVTRTANLQVHQDASYRALLKSRLLATTVHNTRFVRPVEGNQVVQQTSRGGAGSGSGGGAASTKQGGFGDAVHRFGKRMLEAQQSQTASYLAGNGPRGAKRARFSPDEPIRSVLFALYEDKLFWTTKDLRAASGGRSETEIKKVLSEIANYHRSGELKNTWELKKEYQSAKHQQLQQSQQQQGAGGGGDGPQGSDGAGK